MAEERRVCSSCAAPLPAGVLGVLCPRCLLNLGLEAVAAGEQLAFLAADPTSPAREVPEQIGPYKRLAVLGEGGMGVVFLAEQEQPIRRRVAIKLIKRGMDSKEVLGRFESERQALALMNHPGIAKVFDAGTSEQGLPYFVMEHVPGIAITEYCDRKRLAPPERLELFLDVCLAIQHAHTKGIIHRDIKPSNVLVSLDDGKPHVKVIDFGVAKATTHRLTERTLFTSLGVMIGTPGYMSPEQSDVTGLDVDTRSDIYSLGVLVYELLAGATPFDSRRLRHAGWAEIQRIIREEEPPRPSMRVTGLGGAAADVAKCRGTDVAGLARHLRGDLDWITLKALEKDRTRRYQSASELAADVRRHLNNEPVVAGPPGLRYRFTKAVKRHKALFAAAAAVAATMAVGLVVASLLYLRADAARKETRRQVISLQVKEGMRLTDESDALAALPWLVEALKRDESEPDRLDAHRHRIAATLADLPALKAIYTHAGGISEAVFSPDGSAVATASADQTARVWNVASGEPISPTLSHEGPVWSVSFSPEGRRVVTASEDGTSRIWDVKTGRSLIVLKHGGRVSRALFSPDGTQVATVSADDTAVIWDAESGRRQTTMRHGDDAVWAEFSPDGRSLLTASLEHMARLWDVVSGRPKASLFLGLNQTHMAAFSRDGRRIVTTGGGARVWDAATGTPLTLAVGHDVGTFFADFSPDRRRLVVAVSDNAAHVWDLETGAPLYPPVRLTAVPAIVRFSPDGLLLATATQGGRVQLWGAASGEPMGAQLHHAGIIRSAVFDSTGRFLLTAGDDRTARVWDLATTEPVRPTLPHTSRRVVSGQFSGDGRAVFTWTLDRSAADTVYARVWDASSGDPLTPPLRTGSWPVVIIRDSASADGRLVATAGGQMIRLWKTADGEPLRPPLVHGGWVSGYEWDSDGQRLLTIENSDGSYWETGDGPARAHLWDVETGRESWTPLAHERALFGARLTPDGRNVVTATMNKARIWNADSGIPVSPPLTCGEFPTLAVSPLGDLAVWSQDNKLRVWSLPSAQLLASPREVQTGTAMAYSDDGAKLVTGSVGGDVQIWDGRTVDRLGPAMKHQGLVYTAQFSADRSWLLTSSRDHTARVWDAESGEPVTPPLRHRDTVWSATFAPDTRSLLTTSSDGTARTWVFVPETRPVEDLERLAMLVSGRRFVGANNTVNLVAEELADTWSRLRQRYPHAFEPSPEQLLAWHRTKAEALLHEGRWREALVHLDRAMALGPPSWALLVSRGRAKAELSRWRESATDHAAAVAMIPGELEVAHSLALGCLLSGEPERFREVRRSLIDLWSQTQNPDRARWAAHALVMAPIEDALAQAQAVKWAATALAIEPDRPERLALHGAALYRAGRDDSAMRELEKAIRGAGEQNLGSTPAFLAMACRRLGRAAEAARWLARATRELREADAAQARHLQRPGSAADATLAWWQREELRLLVREARATTAGWTRRP